MKNPLNHHINHGFPMVFPWFSISQQTSPLGATKNPLGKAPHLALQLLRLATASPSSQAAPLGMGQS